MIASRSQGVHARAHVLSRLGCSYEADVATLNQDDVANLRKINADAMELGKVIYKLSKAQIARDDIKNALAVAKQAENLLKKAQTSPAQKGFAEFEKNHHAPQAAALLVKQEEAKKKVEADLGGDAKDAKQAAAQMSRIMATLTKLDTARTKREGPFKNALLKYWTCV